MAEELDPDIPEPWYVTTNSPGAWGSNSNSPAFMKIEDDIRVCNLYLRDGTYRQWQHYDTAIRNINHHLKTNDWKKITEEEAIALLPQ